jgi:hypothetical protein
MAMDIIGTTVTGGIWFIVPLLVEMCGDNTVDTLYLLDGGTGDRETPLVLDACYIQYFDTGYGVGGHDVVLLSRVLGSGVYDTCHNWHFVLATQGLVGSSIGDGGNCHCYGTASVGIGYRSSIDMAVVGAVS